MEDIWTEEQGEVLDVAAEAPQIMEPVEDNEALRIEAGGEEDILADDGMLEQDNYHDEDNNGLMIMPETI